VGVATFVPGQQRSFLRLIRKGPGQDSNKSLLYRKAKKNTTTVLLSSITTC